ncbi:Nn.00g032050.m01.CDS01 [Neocucurbitaria sp. VM-36]
MSSLSASSSPSRLDKKTKSHDKHDGHPEDATVPWFPSPMDGWNEEAHSIMLKRIATPSGPTSPSFSFYGLPGFTLYVLMQGLLLTLFGNAHAATPHWIYRVSCFALLLSRAWLALQYLVTAIMCTSRNHRKLRLTLPLALNSLLFLSIAAVFGGLLGGFSNVRTNLTGVLIGVYVVLTLEFFATLTISMIWRKLSFKATHIGERLALLGLIIIGEGVIGTTKTIVRTMGKNGPTFEASAQVFCIILILVFMWVLYFDKVPHYRFGTVQQQLWMALHLPFHLAILGVVEGSQQLVQARYIYFSKEKLLHEAWYRCVGNHLDGQALTTNLTKNIEYFKINQSAQGTLALDYVYREIYLLGNTTNVCSPSNTTDYTNDFGGVPHTFANFISRAIGAMVQAFEIDIPPEGEVRSSRIALRSWTVIYTYFWSAIILLLASYTITSLLSDADVEYGPRLRRYISFSILSRALMISLAVVMLVVGLTNFMFLQGYIASAWILPTVVLSLFIICWSDRGSKLWRQRQGQMRRYEGVASMPIELQQEVGGGPVQRRRTNGYGYPSY